VHLRLESEVLLKTRDDLERVGILGDAETRRKEDRRRYAAMLLRIRSRPDVGRTKNRN
jgi:hypothetical protein